MTDATIKDATPGGPDAQFADHLERGELALQSCAGCGKQVFPPRVACPHCGSDRLAFRAVSGRGTVYSTTVVRRKPEEGGDYNLALIDLEEGARLMSRVEGIAPERVVIGQKVAARIAPKAGPKGETLILFDPVLFDPVLFDPA